MSFNGSRAVVLLSGGLDSTVTLAIASKEMKYECHALTVNYRQRLSTELAAAERVARQLGAASHLVIDSPLWQIAASALTRDSIPVPDEPGDGIPATYVPARNTVLLSYALAWAETLSAGHIFIGVNAIDYSGYPDCRPRFIEAMNAVAMVATKAEPIRIHAPLMAATKADIVTRGVQLGAPLGLTVSCYHGTRCGRCDSCRLRAEGFAEAGEVDPAMKRLKEI